MKLNPEKIEQALQICNKFVTTDYLGNLSLSMYIQSKYTDAWKNFLAKEYFALYPRRKKTPKVYDPTFLEECNTKFVEFFVKPLMKQRIKQYYILEKLFASVELPEPNGFMHEIRSTSVSSYASQGYGKWKYAKNSLIADKVLLETFGYTCDIVEHRENGYDDYYTLIANCPKWVLTKIFHDELTEELIFKIYFNLWKAGSHPLVIFPTGDRKMANFTSDRYWSMTYEQAWESWQRR